MATKLTEEERFIVNTIGHSIYTVNYLETWIGRKDNVNTNAAAALLTMGASGFYTAVKELARKIPKGCLSAGKEIADSLDDCRKEWEVYDPTVGLNGCTAEESNLMKFLAGFCRGDLKDE